MPANIKPEKPASGQESVWDYPRPPRVEKTSKRIRVVFNGITIADTQNAYRLLETSHPPTYYIPQSDIQMEYLSTTKRETFCEFKGEANYWTIEVDSKKAEDAAWMYANPNKGYEVIRNYIAFYPSRIDSCYVDDEQVQAQTGDFYGSWITSDVVGPFKGGAGTLGWQFCQGLIRNGLWISPFFDSKRVRMRHRESKKVMSSLAAGIINVVCFCLYFRRRGIPPDFLGDTF
jgi:uncharacterized protein (DUF427 family)